MRKSIKLEGIAEAWINHEPKTKAISADDVKKAIEWAKVHIHINADDIAKALIRIYGDGFVLGKDAAMHELTGQVLLDWAKWKPGNRGAAALVARYNGLLSLVTNSSQVISGLNTTTYNRLGRVLAESLAEGKSGRATAKRITAEMGHIIDDPARALTIAVTETRRAVSAASMQAYTAAGVKQVSWLIAEGEGLCDACRGNSEDSPVDMGEAFSSGDYAPPAHPNCRCAVQPNVATEVTQDEFESMFAEYEADMALAVMPALIKYRDDQERDAQGRWTASVGGSDLVRRGTEETLKWMESNRFGYRQEDGTFYISEYHEEQAVKFLARKYEAEGLGKRNAVRAAEAEITRLDVQQRCEREIATRAEYEARIAKDDPQWYQETYLPNQEIAQEQIQQAYDTGKVTIAIDPESFIEMLDDGRYKTQFETKTTHGTKDLEMRKVTEDAAMGLPVDMKTSDRPIYGFLTTNNEAITPYDDWAQNRNTTEEKWRDTLSVNSRMADQYGEIRLVMNDDVRDRTTATVDDSLRNARFALPLGTQLTQDDFVFNGAARSGYPDHTGGSPILRYMETQTVGGVRLSDIAEIHAPEELMPEIQVMLERQGLNVPVIARAK